ncbi:alanine/glycine:cation symporter family protein [Caulobacter sp. RL271]|uniref:Alanine:cation symporter family protein n=1 Tax=Caulobacter segnis TaxID=88688 RepID=A0ABY4ZTN8_9CAUL|nr:amino acid carrier protein [Caulobacter segnis]USQ95286.1 alanine:cation symporter family protein [Caulobacter segnis]
MTLSLAGLEAALNRVLGPAADLANAVVFAAAPIGGFKLPVVVIWLVAVSVVMSLYFGLINIRGLPQAVRLARGDFAKPGDRGEVSQFGALSAALAGTLGVGSVAGVALAISIGGAGAMVWMTITGFLGMALKFAECALAVKYRKIGADGVVNGGPMHYLPIAFAKIGARPVGQAIAAFFCVATMLAATSVFQVNQAFVQIKAVTGFASPLLFGLVFAVLVGLVIIGGVKSIARLCTRLVPGLVLAYFVAAAIILVARAPALPGVLASALRGAFDLHAAAGGALGALVVGVQRAVYAGESGLGSAAIAHAAAKTDEPVSEGLVALLEPFVTVVVVCNLTALVILAAGAPLTVGAVGGVEIASAAFERVLPWFAPVLAILVALLAYKTVIGWAYYGERAFGWLFGEGPRRRAGFRLVFLGAVTLAPVLTAGEAIRFLDAMVFAMAAPNTIALCLLAGDLRRDLADYYRRLSGQQVTAALTPLSSRRDPAPEHP